MTSSSSSKTEFTRIFYDVFDVGRLCRCFDATRRLVSNKLEFAQFGAHMKKFWQFCFSPCGSTAVAAVVPLVASSGSTAPVPLYYRLDFGSALFVSGSAVVARQ